MMRLLFGLLLIVGMSFSILSSAQDNKAKACCNKAQATAMKSDCPMKATTVALSDQAKAKADCPVKDCPLADKKDCPKKADCPKANATVAQKPCCAKAAQLADAAEKK